ncbi:MAG: ATP-binding cassette domain-containing protein, partial [Actinomycetota bacterium]|nr:ATP-binding cassette domain-containing protein [Actinomycetota bacterium]
MTSGGLALEGVSRDFAGVRAVRRVTLRVGPGEVVGLVGPNGCGKTTLVNLASGALAPTEGTIAVGGVDLTGAASPRFARAGVVRTFQNLRLFERMSVLDNVVVGAQRGVRPSLVGAWARTPRFRRRERELRERAMRALEGVGLAALAEQGVSALSHGQRRRVELARAFAADPAYLVLDEPGAGVDPDHLARLAELIGERRAAGVGVLLVEHDTGLLERVSDRVAGMVDGAVVAEGPYPA